MLKACTQQQHMLTRILVIDGARQGHATRKSAPFSPDNGHPGRAYEYNNTTRESRWTETLVEYNAS